jgi:pimeloyl-ACP methyl ester carboxylesterase
MEARARVTRLRRLAIASVMALLIDLTSTVADGPPTPTSSFVVVPTPSLAGNMLGEPAEMEVAIWLPASYATTTQRYPVVYFLAGFDESASTSQIGPVLEQLVEEGSAPEMILVGVDGRNSLGGSFYVDSPVTGNWAQAIHTDLVSYVDDNYRTLPTASSRGISGFSMGGFGALDLAMRHPDVFGSVYALSPGLLAPGGLETTEMFDDDEVIASFLELQARDIDGPQAIPGSEALKFSVAYGSAFAPDPDTDFPYVAYPYTEVGRSDLGPMGVGVRRCGRRGRRIRGQLAQPSRDRPRLRHPGPVRMDPGGNPVLRRRADGAGNPGPVDDVRRWPRPGRPQGRESDAPLLRRGARRRSVISGAAEDFYDSLEGHNEARRSHAGREPGRTERKSVFQWARGDLNPHILSNTGT